MLWPRIDQKTCLKAITSAGMEAVPLALALHGDELRTDVAALAAELRRLGAANVVAVVTTTSCFAPRASDDIVAVRVVFLWLGLGGCAYTYLRVVSESFQPDAPKI